MTVVLAVFAVLMHLRQQAEIHLQETTQTLSRSLDLMFEGQIDAIDIALVAAANEIGRMASKGLVDTTAVNRYLELMRTHLPRTQVVRATNEQGDVVYGVRRSEPIINVSDREYFQLLRDEPQTGLIITPPLKGRTTKDWLWVFGRRITKPDGSFGGVVIARLDIPEVENMFRQVKLNTSGFIALRHRDLSLIARYQSGMDNMVPIGDKKISPQLSTQLGDHVTEGTFFINGKSNFDQIDRTLSFRVNRKYGFIVLVGLDHEAAFANWRHQVWLACGLMLALAATAIKIALLVSAAWRRNKQAKASQHVIEEQLRQIAFFDQLTQLPNRRLLGDRLSQTMMAGRRNGNFSALLFIDLDNFKPLNDSHGHEVGDLLLIEVATRLRSCVREVDTVARFGGDEFVVLLGDLSADKTDSAEQARVVAEKIRTAIARPFELLVQREGESARVLRHECTASIGVMLFANQEYGATEIIRMADSAMYRAKDAGRNAIRFVGDH